ncbi:MAG: hypothetical protein ACREFC_01160, partial [Stellaceae bacterium]
MVAAGLALCLGAPAKAQTGVASPPEVTVDLSVLDSMGAPPRHRPVVLRQPHERHEATTKKSAPAKKAAVKPAHPARTAGTKAPPRTAARDEAREQDRRAEEAEKQ